jgi:hypothetical protein
MRAMTIVSQVLQPEQSYTFSKIFDLKIEADELADYFGYTFQRKRLNLPQYAGTIDRLEELRSRGPKSRYNLWNPSRIDAFCDRWDRRFGLTIGSTLLMK